MRVCWMPEIGSGNSPFIESNRQSSLSSAELTILGVVLHISTDDPGFVAEFGSVFGGTENSDAHGLTPKQFSARIHRESPRPGFGWMQVLGDDLAAPDEFLLRFSSPTIPIHRTSDGSKLLYLGDDPEPLLDFSSDEAVLFRRVPRWRRILAHFLFLRLLRLRSELLFFHAASIGIGPRGILLIGPKGSGKSTLSLALAARGHNFLGDETAAYDPATGLLLPFRRPVGIKPGPQSARVAHSIPRFGRDEDGLIRVPVNALFETAEPTAVPLTDLIFLGAFAARPRLEPVVAGREELSQLQPLASSLAGAAATKRVFELVRLLAEVRCHRFDPAEPDQTAEYLEQSLGRWSS